MAKDTWDKNSRLNLDDEVLEHAKFKKVGEKIAVRTCDETAAAILNDILVELGGTATGAPFHAAGQAATNKAVQSVISFTVPGGTTRAISKVIVSCRQSGFYEIKVAGSVVGSGRTGPGNPNSTFHFLPNYVANGGEAVAVEFIQEYGKAGGSVEAYLMGTDT